MDLVIVSISAMITLYKGVCRNVRIALGAVAPTPIRATKAEAILNQTVINDDLF